jgi:hypothetical protein
MAIDWSSVGTNALNAAAAALGAAWNIAQPAASAQIAALMQVGQQIEANRNTISAFDYSSLQLSQQRAMEGVLKSYEGISIVAADQAAAAAWNIVATALKTAYGLPFIP